MCCSWWHYCCSSLLTILRKKIGKPGKKIRSWYHIIVGILHCPERLHPWAWHSLSDPAIAIAIVIVDILIESGVDPVSIDHWRWPLMEVAPQGPLLWQEWVGGHSFVWAFFVAACIRLTHHVSLLHICAKTHTFDLGIAYTRYVRSNPSLFGHGLWVSFLHPAFSGHRVIYTMTN